jgi:tRNA threonylcarbamoyladenosine biosynthesis protein TsaE
MEPSAGSKNILKMFIAEIRSLSEINHVAEKFIEAHPADRLFAFYGKMGSGKTTFIKALCDTLQVIDYVTSPTFALINVYETEKSREIYHFDFYRIKSLEELYDLGYEEYFFSDEYCFVEWPELVESLLPPQMVKVTITETTNGSRIIESN